MNSIVKMEDVCFSYGKEMVLKHISLDIEESRICFLMGNNGAGKTSLLKNIMGFVSPQAGTVQIAGKEVNLYDRNSLSRLVSYVPQAIKINTDFSVIDYLSLGRTPYMGTISKLRREDYEIIEKYAVRLGIDDIYNAIFNNLSGGQKQLVAVARSLVQDTPILIMDEPMSALDIGKQVELLKVLYDLTQQGKTIVLTTHNPNHALVLNSDSCFLKKGKILAKGKSEEIIRDELLHEIYGADITLDHGQLFDSVVFNTHLKKSLYANSHTP